MELPEHKRGWKLEENPRLPEAIPVPNADQPDTPSLGGFVERCLYLFTHRTAKLKTVACTSLTSLPRREEQGKVSGGGFAPTAAVDVPQEKGPDPTPAELWNVDGLSRIEPDLVDRQVLHIERAAHQVRPVLQGLSVISGLGSHPDCHQLD